jgi:ABC-type Na+ efflux pump permease subunit
MSGQSGPGALANVWFIAKNDVRFALSERAVLLWLIVMPPIFFFFIGNATQAGFSAVGAQTQIEMTTPVAEDFVGARLAELVAAAGFEIVASDTANGASSGARLAYSGNLSTAFGNGEGLVLTFASGGPTSAFDRTKMEGAIARLRAELALAAELNLAKTDDSRPVADTLAGFETAVRPVTLTPAPGGRLAKVPTGIEQTVPGIMVMFTMLVLLGSGAVLLFLERQRGVLARLAASPMSRTEIVAGKWAGKMALGLIQIGLAMAMGTLFFGMDWGPNLAMIGVVLTAWAAFCASLGILVGTIGRSQSEVGGIGILATMALAALGGAWWPIEITPQWVQGVQKLVPAGWTMDALGRLISFGDGPGSVIWQVSALAGAALLIGWIGARQFKFK